MTTVRRARRGRTTALAAALVVGAGGAVTMAFAAPAQAATQTISIQNVAYTCVADNSVVSQVLGGPQQVTVRATSQVPDQVAGGATIASTQADLVLTLSAPFVTALNNPALGIERVKGTATATVNLTAVGAGDEVAARAGAPVNGLRVADYAELPDTGSLDLPATGTIPDVKVPAIDGIAYISMPKQFKIQSEVDPYALGSIPGVDLTCERPSSDVGQRLIGQVVVGNGCPAGSTCAFALTPDEDFKVPGGTTPTTGPTSPTDDPTSATPDPTDGSGGGDVPIDDGGSDVSDTGGFVVGGTQQAPARTVAASDELPATGSPVGWLAAAAVLLLAAGRVGMSLRERRATGE